MNKFNLAININILLITCNFFIYYILLNHNRYFIIWKLDFNFLQLSIISALIWAIILVVSVYFKKQSEFIVLSMVLSICIALLFICYQLIIWNSINSRFDDIILSNTLFDIKRILTYNDCEDYANLWCEKSGDPFKNLTTQNKIRVVNKVWNSDDITFRNLDRELTHLRDEKPRRTIISYIFNWNNYIVLRSLLDLYNFFNWCTQPSIHAIMLDLRQAFDNFKVVKNSLEEHAACITQHQDGISTLNDEIKHIWEVIKDNIEIEEK